MMRSKLTFLALVMAAGLAIPQFAEARGGSAAAPAAGSGNAAELRKAGQCAGLFGFLAGQVGSASPQHAAISQRRTAWVEYGTLAAGGDRTKAQTAAINEAIFLTNKMREFGGDQAKFAALVGPLNAQCENAPPKSLPLAVTAAKPAVRAPSAATIKASEGKLECAGFYRYFEDRKRPVPSLAGGNSAMFVDLATKERPDLSTADIAKQVELHRAKWDGLFKQAADDYSAALRRGESSGPKLPPGHSALASRCDEAANFYRKRN